MNHLAKSTSPYLLQHAHNPVDWFPWGEEALAKARSENKPIFLSIGYAACHWCHVMAHESFEDRETTAIMNEYFVCIKVDREERPDLDSIYMQATTAMTGAGGWPMSVFLTPDLRPFYAGTYFPPIRRFNLPSFKEVLLSLAKVWREDPAEADRVGSQVAERIQRDLQAPPDPSTLTPASLDAITETLLATYDWGHGGWGDAPKFPQPQAIEFLLRRAVTDAARRDPILKAATHALQAMARGGMYDVVGGGFARYSTDASWHIPHFEKMLYDNAQLALAYLHAWQITGEPLFQRVVTETLQFVIREMTHASGGFYSSLDADSEGREGKFYAWTKDEIGRVLAENPDRELFEAAYGITDQGNWEGQTVLQRALDEASLASRYKLTSHQVAGRLSACHASLLAARAARPRPATDDKVLTAWNGFMLAAFAQAARGLDLPALRREYLDVATRNADFLLSDLRPNGGLRRAWRNGTATGEVFLEDYAALILGLLELYQTDFNNRWFIASSELAEEMIARFSDPAGGFFDTPKDGEPLLVRPKDIQDNATPSGNSLACEALLKLAAFTDNGRYRDLAEKGLTLVTGPALRYPTAFARWCSVADFALATGSQIAILRSAEPEDPEWEEIVNVLRSGYRPRAVAAASPYPPPKDAPALLQDRPLKGGRTTVYVCQSFVCNQPVNTAAELREQL